MRLRLCTFNIENLFTRFDFSAFTDEKSVKYLPPIVQFYGQFGDGDFSNFPEFKRMVQTAALSQDDDKRQQTALAMAEADADLFVLQEVDSFDAMARFLDAYLKKTNGEAYHNRVLHEGNDFRGIDVAAFSTKKYPFYSRSHAWVTPGWVDDTDSGKALLAAYPDAKKKAATLTGAKARIFRRDCLELELRLKDQMVSVFNCHFKSMGGWSDDKGMSMRQLEALTVREIIQRKFDDPATALWAVCGDLNDAQSFRYVSKVRNADGSHDESHKAKPASGQKESGVDPLLDGGFGVNLADALPEDARWTHYYAGSRHKTQLDYIIASPALADKMKGKPTIVRAGQPLRVPNLDVPRYPRLGWDRPKASDHCPLVAEFDI